jgi:hypothetical protein
MWGAVAFLNLTSVSDSNTTALQAPKWAPASVSESSSTSTPIPTSPLDFGFGARGSNGLFLGTSEAF